MYAYLRQAMQKMIDWFESLGLNIILVGHVKDKMIGKDSEELNLRTLDLTGKISNILSAKSDAIGYIFRQPMKIKYMFNLVEVEMLLLVLDHHI